mgnify:CR=1 FL=1
MTGVQKCDLPSVNREWIGGAEVIDPGSDEDMTLKAAVAGLGRFLGDEKIPFVFFFSGRRRHTR